MDNKCYFACYEYTQDNITIKNNYIIKGMHPVIWISRPNPNMINILKRKVLLFWSEISTELYEEAKQLKYFPVTDYTEEENLCQKSKLQ